ncbi:MAG: hypothetical protein RIF32_21415 [Leptospirales bacterium]|jgi:hypothetical protein
METLRWRFDAERRRGSTQTTLGLLALCAAALGLFGNFLVYGLPGGAAVPAAVRVLFFLFGTGSLLLGFVFLARALMGGDAASGESDELRINPGLASIGTPADRAIESLSAQYGVGAAAFASRNETRARDLALGGWSLVGGLVFPLVLLIWIFAASAPPSTPTAQTRSWIFGAPAHPSEISQDHSAIPLRRAGTPPNGALSPGGSTRASEIDGACCLFEDRRPTR